MRDVYGDSVDKVIQGNTSNIIYLKSTDETMLEDLAKISGITHKVYRDGKSVTKDVQALALGVEGKVTYNYNAVEKAVIDFNDLMYIEERNSIVLRAGKSPIWNRNETILPMAWRLHMNQITDKGKKYALQTVPTLSTAKDFDLRANQPDFKAMVYKKIRQAMLVPGRVAAYKECYGYNDDDIGRLDPDVYGAVIMRMVNGIMNPIFDKDITQRSDEVDNFDYGYTAEELAALELEAMGFTSDMSRHEIDNNEQAIELEKASNERESSRERKFAELRLSPYDVMTSGKQFDEIITKIISAPSTMFTFQAFADSDPGLSYENGILYAKVKEYIEVKGSLKSQVRVVKKPVIELTEGLFDDVETLTVNSNESEESSGSMPVREKGLEGQRSYMISPDFYKFLSDLDSWKHLGCDFESRFIQLHVPND